MDPDIRRAATTADPATSEEDRLIQAMDEYRAALDAGEPLDQDALLARYPDLADELAACFDGMEFTHNIAPQLAEPAPEQRAASSSDIHPTAALGDFCCGRMHRLAEDCTVMSLCTSLPSSSVSQR